jgi:YD repeat-containing protein
LLRCYCKPYRRPKRNYAKYNLNGVCKLGKIVEQDGITINYTYDAEANRVLKKVWQPNGAVIQIFYKLDAIGNVI